MSEKKPGKGPYGNTLRDSLLVIGLGVLLGFCYTIIDARQHGQSIEGALHQALTFQSPRFWVAIIIAVLAAGFIAIRNEKWSPGGNGTFEEWQRLTRRNTAVEWSVAAFIGISTLIECIVLRSVDRRDLFYLFCVLFYIGNILHRSARNTGGVEYYQALTTGDSSRWEDERAGQIKGKAATTTLYALGISAIAAGVIYETLYLGAYPDLTCCAAALAYIVWGASYWYWNRKL